MQVIIYCLPENVRKVRFEKEFTTYPHMTVHDFEAFINTFYWTPNRQCDQFVKAHASKRANHDALSKETFVLNQLKLAKFDREIH